MGAKKNILFIMNNLRVGGAEKALISLLQTIDYSAYHVDLLLFKKEGLFLKQIPSAVVLLEEPQEYRFFDMSFKKALVDALKIGRIDIVWNRIKMAYLFKTEKNGALREQKMWRYLGKTLQPLSKKYDAAIGYLEKTPNYFCVDKVDAKVKIGWIHTDYIQLQMDARIDLPYFQKLDKIITISEECKVILERVFPSLSEKIILIHNIVSSKMIQLLSDKKVSIDVSTKTIISVGRLVKLKGYELAIAACRILKKQGVVVKWYVLGEGEERVALEKLITEFEVQDNFILLGIIENPYPYVKQADVYVHTSRFEGKSIAIDEAKILNKPIVVTNFETIFDQIENEVNGLIVNMNPEAIANGIQRILQDSAIRNTLISNLEKEKKGNEDEIEKLYQIINQ